MLKIQFEIFRKGLTNRQVAEQAEVAPETLSRIISGKQTPGFKRGQSGERIAKALGWKNDPAELFAEIEVS